MTSISDNATPQTVVIVGFFRLYFPLACRKTIWRHPRPDPSQGVYLIGHQPMTTKKGKDQGLSKTDPPFSAAASWIPTPQVGVGRRGRIQPPAAEKGGWLGCWLGVPLPPRGVGGWGRGVAEKGPGRDELEVEAADYVELQSVLGVGTGGLVLLVGLV